MSLITESRASPESLTVVRNSRCWAREMALQDQFRHADDRVQGRADLMAHVRQEGALGAAGRLRRLPGLFQVRVRAGQLGRPLLDPHFQLVPRRSQFPFRAEHALGALALGDVSDGAQDEHPLLHLQRPEADLRRELAPVLAEPIDLDAGPHRSNPGRSAIAGNVPVVLAAETVRYDHLDRSAEQFLPGIAEQAFHLGIDHEDLALPIGDNDAVGRGFQEPPEQSLSVSPVAYVQRPQYKEASPAPSQEHP